LAGANLLREESSRPHVVNLLTVSISSGKRRLNLDLRHVNKEVRLTKVKFKFGKTADQYLTSYCFGFVFDLKWGYHHIIIFPNHQKYLGYSWKFGETINYFVFTVLPFNLSSSGYIFTKIVQSVLWLHTGVKTELKSQFI